MENLLSDTKNSLISTDWKLKALKRGKEAKALNKRIRELTASRDLWKSKYFESKTQSDIWESELVKIKKKLNEILSQEKIV
jgi:hypothetical protein